MFNNYPYTWYEYAIIGLEILFWTTLFIIIGYVLAHFIIKYW